MVGFLDFENYDLGPIEGQKLSGGVAGEGENAWTTYWYNPDPPPAPDPSEPQIIADPTGAGKGKLLDLPIDDANYVRTAILSLSEVNALWGSNENITLEWDFYLATDAPGYPVGLWVMAACDGEGFPDTWYSYTYPVSEPGFADWHPNNNLAGIHIDCSLNEWHTASITFERSLGGLTANLIAATLDDVPIDVSIYGNGTLQPGSWELANLGFCPIGLGSSTGHDEHVYIGGIRLTGLSNPVPIVQPPSYFEKRYNMTDGTFDGKRRKWEARFYRQSTDPRTGTVSWIRVTPPAKAPTSCSFTYVDHGGMAEANVSYPLELFGPSTLQDGDRLEIWVKRDAWEIWYRGEIRLIDQIASRPGSVEITAFGPMEMCQQIDFYRDYALPNQDVSVLFGRLVTDYLDPERARRGLPPLIRDIREVGEEAGLRTFNGNLHRAFSSLVDDLFGVVYGFDLDESRGYADRIYLRRRDTEVAYAVSLGKDASKAQYDLDTSTMFNVLEITGATPDTPNLVPNGGFERPTATLANLIQNPSFEVGNKGRASHWGVVSGDPSRKSQSDDSNIQGHSGEWFMEFDQYKRGVEEIQSDFTALTGVAAVQAEYEFRCWVALENYLHPATLQVTINAYDSTETLVDTLTFDINAVEQKWVEIRKAFRVTGEIKFQVHFLMTAGGGFNKGVYIDDVELYNRTMVRQEGWTYAINGGADLLAVWDASPAPQGSYYVSLEYDTTGTDQSIKIRPEEGFMAIERQTFTMKVRLRYWGAGSTDVQVGIEKNKNNEGWGPAIGALGETGKETVTLTEAGTVDWPSTTVYGGTPSGDSDDKYELRPYILIPQGFAGTLGIDAVMVVMGHGLEGTDDEYYIEGGSNLIFKASTDDAWIQDPSITPTLTDADRAYLAAHIGLYGRRSARIDSPKVRNLTDARKAALNFFRISTTPKTPSPLTVHDKWYLIRFEGNVRLTNLPEGILLPSLFPRKLTHQFDRRGYLLEMDRDVEKPNNPRLWKDLQTAIENLSVITSGR